MCLNSVLFYSNHQVTSGSEFSSQLIICLCLCLLLQLTMAQIVFSSLQILLMQAHYYLGVCSSKSFMANSLIFTLTVYSRAKQPNYMSIKTQSTLLLTLETRLCLKVQIHSSTLHPHHHLSRHQRTIAGSGYYSVASSESCFWLESDI